MSIAMMKIRDTTKRSLNIFEVSKCFINILYKIFIEKNFFFTAAVLFEKIVYDIS